MNNLYILYDNICKIVTSVQMFNCTDTLAWMLHMLIKSDFYLDN